MDFLGLRNLTAIQDCLRMIKKDTGLDINLQKIDYDEPEVYKLIASGNTVGIFQLESGGMTSFMKDLQPDCLEDFDSLYDSGCRFQINYLSLTGAYGPASIKILKYLQKRGMCGFFSSDLHSLTQLDRILDGRIVFPLRKFRNI